MTTPLGASLKPEQLMQSEQVRQANLVVIWRTVSFVVFVWFSLLATTAWLMWSSRLIALEAANLVASNLTESVAAQLRATVRQADTVLHALSDQLHTHGTVPENITALRAFARQALAAQPQLDDVRFFDARGEPLVSGRQTATVSAGLSALVAHHRLHQAPNPSGLSGPYVSALVKGEPAGTWRMALSRRLNDEQGGFAGVVVAVLRASYFQQDFGHMDLGAQGRIALQLSDSRLVFDTARHADGVWRIFANPTLYPGPLPLGRDGAVVPALGLDGVPRRTTYRDLPGYNVRVVTSSTEEHALAVWRKAVKIDVAVLGILLVIVGGGGARLVRHARERARSEMGVLKSLSTVHNLEQALNEHALVSVTNVRGTILRVNDTFCKISKYSRQELVGRDHGMLNSGAHPPEFFHDLWRTLKAGEIWKGEICNRAKDGTLYWVRSTMMPVFDESSKVIQYVSIRTDITERKNAENALAQARQALEENNRDLNRLAHIDALTGLANRRRFDQLIDIEFRRTLRAAQPLSLLMIDVDFFKRYNDLYGHVAGDDCLRQVAEILHKNQRRAGDLAARYGGEEFAILLPNTENAGAALIAEKIRVQTEGLSIAHAASDFGRVTLSIGVVSMVPVRDKNTATELVQLADACLYEAKRTGRNRVHSGTQQTDSDGLLGQEPPSRDRCAGQYNPGVHG